MTTPIERTRRPWAGAVAACGASIAGAASLAGLALTVQDARAGEDRACSRTARAAFLGCRAEIKDDFWIATGNCINVDDDDEREECQDEAREALAEGRHECAAQFGARLDVCAAVGEARYDPEFNPADFVDPTEIGSSVDPNPYFPLVAGNQWVYEGRFVDEEGDEVTEIITVTVTEKTKLIEGVTCVVVTDVVEEDGEEIERTDDWYGQDLIGNVWYCGEISLETETFDGDDPEEPEIVTIEGSWKAGRERAQPGIIAHRVPEVGTTFRQEVALGEAEDVGEVLSVTGSEDVPAASCAGDCLVTRDFTPLEPGVDEIKYYAPGVGLILEVTEEGDRVELIELAP